MDLAVDREGHLPVDEVAEAREPRVERGDHLAHGRRLDLELRCAPSEGPALAAHDDVGHGQPALLSMAASTLGGESGRSGIRTPMAPRTALATAASGGTI